MKDDKKIEKLNTLKKIIKQKILVVGDSGVGKSSLVSKVFGKSIKNEKGEESNEIANFSMTKEFGENIINYEIWDTCIKLENPIIHITIPELAKEMSLVIIVYSIDNEASFNHLENWFNLIKGIKDMSKIIILGNKADLSHRRVYSEEKSIELLEDFCKKKGIKTYLESSAEEENSVKELAELINNNAVKGFKHTESIENEKKGKAKIVEKKNNCCSSCFK